MVEPHQGQQRGVQVGGVHSALDGVDAVLVGGAVAETVLDAGAGEPHRVAGDVVVAAVDALGGRHAAELAAEEHERLVEQAAPFEVGQQGGSRAGRPGADWLIRPLVQVAVMVPARLRDLDEAARRPRSGDGPSGIGGRSCRPGRA